MEEDPVLGGGPPINVKPVKRPPVSGVWGASAGQSKSMASMIGSKNPNVNARLNKTQGEPYPTLDGSKGNAD